MYIIILYRYDVCYLYEVNVLILCFIYHILYYKMYYWKSVLLPKIFSQFEWQLNHQGILTVFSKRENLIQCVNVFVTYYKYNYDTIWTTLRIHNVICEVIFGFDRQIDGNKELNRVIYKCILINSNFIISINYNNEYIR